MLFSEQLQLIWVILLKFTIKIAMLMTRFKPSPSQLKLKTKPSLPSPSSKTSLSKTKDKLDKRSPRANRLNTIPDKTNNEPSKRIPVTIITQKELLFDNINHKYSANGYETPKFKCAQDISKQARGTQPIHNFFSFGETQNPAEAKRKCMPKDASRNKENVMRGKQVRESGKARRQAVVR